MDWHILVLAAAEACSQVLVVVLFGVLLSKTGYLTPAGQKALSKVNLYFLTPCLLFVKIASEISWDQFVAFWPIPVFFAIFSIASWFLARIGSFLLGFTTEERNFVIASIMFANTNTLPMALMQSLAFSDAGKNLLRDELDSPAQVAARGFSYILFYAIFGNFVRWSYGFNLLVPQEPIVSPPLSPSGILVVNSLDSDLPQGPRTVQDRLPAPLRRAQLRKTFRRASRTIRQLMTPPLVTAIISLVVGLVPFLHKILMTTDSKIYTFLVRPLDDCGAAAIPMIVLCLGAQVVDFCKSGENATDQSPQSTVIPVSQDAQQIADSNLEDDARCGDLGDSTIEKTIDESQSPQINPAFFEPLSRASTRSTLLNEQPSSNSGGSSARWPSISLNKNTAASTLAISASGPPSALKKEKFYALDSRRPSQVTLTTGNGPSEPFSSSSSPSPAEGCESVGESSGGKEGLQHSKNQVIPREYQQQARHKLIGPIPYILLIRLLILPLVCLPIVMYHPRSLFPPMLATDPTFSLALVLLASSPTAINIIQMCQIKGFFEKEMAGVLFWSYCILGVPCVLGWSVVSLWVAAR